MKSGRNGLPGYEYLIVKYSDFDNRSGIFVLFCHNGTGQFGGCKVHGGGSAIDLDSSIIDYITCKVEDSSDPGNTKELNSWEKFRVLFTQGAITGTNWNRKDRVTISLESAVR